MIGQMAANTFALEAVAELVLDARRHGALRHPARGGDRQDVERRPRLAAHRRHGADQGRPRLRDGGVAHGARRAARPRRAHHAGLPHQPDLRGQRRDHAPVHRPRGGGPAPQGGGRPHRSAHLVGTEGAGAPPRRRLLRHLVPEPLLRLEPLAALRGVRRAGAARAVHRAHVAPAGAHDLPRDGALRAEAREAAVGAVPAGGRRRRAVRDERRPARAPQRSASRATRRRWSWRTCSAATPGAGCATPSARVFANDDVRTYGVAQDVLQGRHTWLEQGLV